MLPEQPSQEEQLVLEESEVYEGFPDNEDLVVDPELENKDVEWLPELEGHDPEGNECDEGEEDKVDNDELYDYSYVQEVDRDDEDDLDGDPEDEMDAELGPEDGEENWDDDPFIDENYASL
jgi:hypothetical protein